MAQPLNRTLRRCAALVVVSVTLSPSGCGWLRPKPERIKANYEYFEDGRHYFPKMPGRDSQLPTDGVRLNENQNKRLDG
jgi:hypothetical protein